MLEKKLEMTNARMMYRVPIAAVAADLGGAITMLAVILPLHLWLHHVSPMKVLQSIASGMLGKEAYGGGVYTALLGVVLHCAFSVTLALFYIVLINLSAKEQRFSWKRASIFGTLAFFVMTLVVMPRSAIGGRPPLSIPFVAFSLAIHILSFALPISFIANSLLSDQ